jgi:secondary thiamine-phosphate synthase enzyme
MDITDRLAGLVAAFGLSEGRIHVFPLHTTMGVIVTEREALLHLDLRGQLERLVPSKAVYNHDQLHLREHISDNERLNGAAHCRQLLLPPELSVPVVGGKLRLGTWQRVFLIELDGPQVRKVLVQMEGDFDHTYQQDKAITLERALLRAPERDPADVRLPMGALLSGGGKRIRPRLAMLAAELGPRYDGDAAVRLGVALELLHNATLIHDDIVDHSPFRRDSPTIHVVYGCPTATRVGVYYFGRSYAILAALGNPRVSRLVMDAIALLGRGQLEEYRERRGRSEKARYFAIAAKKTSALTAAACAAGAALSGADQATIDALSVFGQQLGMAFQVVDDVLDFSPTSGKRVGQDARQAVASLPMLFVEDDSQRKQVEELLLSGEESDTEAALELMRRSAALEKSMSVARHFRDGALKALETLRPHPAANGLRELADFAVARDR